MANEMVQTSMGTLEFGRQANAQQSAEMVKMCMDNGCFDFDTAYLYADGKSEKIIGDLEVLRDDPRVIIATKANPWSDKGLQYDRVLEQMNTSLKRLKTKCVDIFYLHTPDHNTPIEETLKAVDQLYQEGKFKEFGLSNYAAWETVEIYNICKENGYVLPTVYQGLYNALARGVEAELFPCMRRYGIRFYAFNPLSGGLLTGKYQYIDKDDKQPFGRFFGLSAHSAIYCNNYWHKPIFDTLDKLKEKLNGIYGEGKVSITEASLRWLYHHSMMSGKYGDVVILGASKIEHLEENLKASKQGPLHDDIVKIFDEGWRHTVKGICPAYNR